MGQKAKKYIHHTFYNISALRWTFKLIQTVFNYKKKKCVLGCKKALFCHCVFPLEASSTIVSTLLVIKMEYIFLHNFMGYFLLWEIFRMSRVFTTTMLRSTSLFLTYSHKIRQYSPSTRCVLSLKRKGATGTAELRILSPFIDFSQFYK